MEGQPTVWTSAFLFVLRYHSAFLKESEAFLVKQVDEVLRSSAKDEKRTAADDLNIWAVNDFFPNRLRYSMFTTLYSEFEFYINQACVEFESFPQYRLRLKEVAGDGIHRSYTYLRKVIQMEHPYTEESWSKLNDLNRLRNVIIHRNGQVPNDKKFLDSMNRLKVWTDLTINNTSNRVEFSPASNYALTDFLKSCAEHLHSELLNVAVRDAYSKDL